MWMGDVKEQLEEFYEAWNSHDVDTIVSYFTDDCVYEDATLGVINHGQTELKTFLHEFFNATPDLRLEVNAAFISGNWGGTEWIMSGTHKGDFRGIPPTGKRFSFRGASITEIHDGKFNRHTDYYDLTSILQQIGYLPSLDSQLMKIFLRFRSIFPGPPELERSA
jgi:steroid delta-isomerase-like uncharacterized protein